MNDNKKQMIDELFNMLRIKGKELYDEDVDPHITANKLDVLLDIMKFLKEYDENVKVLNEHWYIKRRQEKYGKDIDIF